VAHLTDLFDMLMFREMQNAGFIKVQRHPEFPDQLAIANYTHKAQQNYHWNAVTEQCRGLIYNPTTLEVVARPFRKFFNYGEAQADKITGQEEVTAYEKFDGSLGIAYPLPGYDEEVYAIATRGSFTSEQAVWATNYLTPIRATEPWRFPMIPGYTDLFEIIYPDNRIVCEYGGMEGLVYLGTIHNDTGSFQFEDDMFDVRADPVYHGKFEGVLQIKGREGKEGVVVVTSDNRRVKFKEEEYVRLHRIVSKLSEKSVWEAMGGPDFGRARELAQDIPEEHAASVLEVARKLLCEFVIQSSQVSELTWNTKNMTSRKEKAVFVTQSGYPKHVQSAYFAQLDGKDSSEVLWKAVRPTENDEGEEE